MIAFAAALEIGAGIECDLRLTADNQIVVFHDADAWRMCASPIRIGKATLADLSRLAVGGAAIPTLESLFAMTAGRVPLLLEVKVDADIWRWVPALRPLLTSYNGPVGVMSFDPRLPRLLKTNLPQVRRGLVVRERLRPVRRWLAMRLASPQFLAVERTALGSRWIGQARRRMPVCTWTICNAGERAQAQVQSDALIWEGDGRPRN